MSADSEAELIAEQLRHTIDLLRAEIQAAKVDQAHQKELFEHRIGELERERLDHENRLRVLQDGVTSFKVWSGLANGGSGVLALIAFLKAFIGVP